MRNESGGVEAGVLVVAFIVVIILIAINLNAGMVVCQIGLPGGITTVWNCPGNVTEAGTGMKDRAQDRIWGATETAIAGSVTGMQDVLYSVPAGADGIYRYNGKPGEWTKIGGPGKMFVLDDGGNLYGLSPDGSGVYRYDGSPLQWTKIGGAAGSLYAGGRSLFATNPETGDVYQYQGTPSSWVWIGGAGKMFAVDGNGRIYGISPDGSGLYAYNEASDRWTRIADQTSAVYAGGSRVYAAMGGSDDIYRYNDKPFEWTRIGAAGTMFAVNDAGQIYRLSLTGNEVERYDGGKDPERAWTLVIDNTRAIFAGGKGQLFITEVTTGDLYAITG